MSVSMSKHDWIERAILSLIADRPMTGMEVEEVVDAITRNMAGVEKWVIRDIMNNLSITGKIYSDDGKWKLT